MKNGAVPLLIQNSGLFSGTIEAGITQPLHQVLHAFQGFHAFFVDEMRKLLKCISSFDKKDVLSSRQASATHDDLTTSEVVAHTGAMVSALQCMPIFFNPKKS